MLIAFELHEKIIWKGLSTKAGQVYSYQLPF